MGRRGPTRHVSETEADCHRCDRRLPIGEFHRCRRAGITAECKDCQRTRYRLRIYGISQEQYDAMASAAGHGCRICGAAVDSERNRQHKVFSVDHCHATGAVRGLLCHHCNSGLGHFADTPETLEAAAAYLRRARSLTTP